MASAEAAVVAILELDAGVTALVGTRIYPKVLPQNVTYPAIRYQRISTARGQFRVMTRSGGKATRQQPRFQLDSYGLTESSVQAVAAAVRAALDGYAGVAATLKIDQILIEDEGGDLELDVGDDSASVNRVRQDYLVSHAE